ncbi:MAG: FecR family protein, partial [Rikenellaceae bacterium]
RKRIALSSAAVAAGIVALFFYLFTIPSNVQQPKANIVTVVERPRIIMEDNSVVELNSDKYVSEKGVLKTEMKNPERHLIVPAGCTFTIELEDRSLITLNAGSELIYPVTFTAEQREVKLRGEGYFKVKKSDLPFIVSSDGLRVKVYGTEFNVCSSSDGITEVVLVSGSVGVNRNNDQIMLKPNEMYQLNNRTKEGIVKKVNAGEMLGWLENNFDYGNISLEQLLSKISAWYGVEFKFENRNSKDVYASRDGSLDELLTVLEKITGLTFERESNYQYLIK